MYLEWLQYEKKNDKQLEDSIIKYFEEQNISPSDLNFVITKMSPSKICNYVKKQSNAMNRPPKELISTWEDYMSMGKKLKMDTDQEQIYKPKNLEWSHNSLVALCGGKEIVERVLEVCKLFPDVDDICQSIREKYEFKDKHYQIVVPQKVEDIIMEGRVLGHCLDRGDIYFERIHSKESFIVFLRKADEPEIPYYTLEIEPGGTARQKRTLGDKQNADFEEAKKFILKWQKQIRKRLSAEDMALAEKSAVLRVEELRELRRTQAKIWHGHLSGKLLADVLEEDLMEAEMSMGEERKEAKEQELPQAA